MPGGDRTGPMGMGPMTGRGAGYCAGFASAGVANRAGGGGFWGRGCGVGGRGGRGGGGRGRRNMFYATGLPGWARTGAGAGAGTGETAPPAAGPRAMSRQEELEQLKQQAQQAASVLEQIQQRIDALAGESHP